MSHPGEILFYMNASIRKRCACVCVCVLLNVSWLLCARGSSAAVE